jgi:hypothetical protein
VSTYWIDPTLLDSRMLDECWAWGSEHTTITVSLTSRDTAGADGSAAVRALVRYIGPPTDEPPFEQLRPLPGHQSTALLASLPAGVTAADLPVEPGFAAQIGEGLQVPIGPSGQILGAISGRPSHALALPLYDPARYNPRQRTIDVHAELPVAQQIVLRAAVVGADVEIHTTRPHRWRQLVTAVGDPRTLRLAQPAADGTGAGETGPATIAVFDQLAPTATSAQTTITVSEPGGPTQPSAHLAINQIGERAVNVSIPMHTVRVDLVEPVGELRYLDQR